ncbi:hypothetical protein BGX31_004464 [Mortierella sp. GBA43]|nr:hypothetical protein BGX31_004464 [Mortierella sp. GBA43]
MASGFNFSPPGGAPNANSTTPLRPYFGSPLDSPLQSYYQNAVQLEHEIAAQKDINSQVATKELLNYGLIKFFTLGVAAPFEAAQTLIQVQYLPNDDEPEDKKEDDAAEQERRDEEFRRAQEEAEEEEFLNSESGTGGYYSSDTRGADHFPAPRSSANKLDSNSSVFKERREFDQSGYLIRTDVYDDDLRPAFQLPPQEEGTWQVVKGLPTLEATLNDTFDLYDDTIPLVHLDRVGPNIATIVASHVVVGVLLAPLELARTRLVVQSSDPKQRKYTGMLNCISTIISEEGFTALWGGVNLAPTILYHTARPLISNLVPLIIDRVFNISSVDSPVLYSLAELALDIVDLLIILPIETVRKRLQIQIQAKIPGKRYETVVETRKRPYAGIVDCVRKIVQEEGGKPRRRRSSKRKHGVYDDSEPSEPRTPWYGNWAVRRLYTGLGIHLTTNIGLFAVSAVTKLQDDSDDW